MTISYVISLFKFIPRVKQRECIVKKRNESLPLASENPFILSDSWLTSEVIKSDPLSPSALAYQFSSSVIWKDLLRNRTKAIRVGWWGRGFCWKVDRDYRRGVQIWGIREGHFDHPAIGRVEFFSWWKSAFGPLSSLRPEFGDAIGFGRSRKDLFVLARGRPLWFGWALTDSLDWQMKRPVLPCWSW